MIFVQNQANHALEWLLKGCSGVLKGGVAKRDLENLLLKPEWERIDYAGQCRYYPRPAAWELTHRQNCQLILALEPDSRMT